MAEEGQVISCHSIEQWTLNLDKAVKENKLVVIDFTASWCGPCRVIAPVLAECAKKHPNILFLKVDVDEMKEIAEEWKINSMPTFIFLKNGEKVHQFSGARKEVLLAAIAEHSKPSEGATSATTTATATDTATTATETA